MVDRVIIGSRGAEIGLWCSKPGFDVNTAGANDLLLDMSFRSEQIIQMGAIAFGGTVGLGLSVAPIVIPYAITGSQFGSGIIRPVANQSPYWLEISASSFSLTGERFYGGGGGAPPAITHQYMVLRRAL